MIRKGYYSNGAGLAHNSNDSYIERFGMPMFGTFNLEVGNAPDIHSFKPCFQKSDCVFYLIRLVKDGAEVYGYVTKPRTSGQRNALYEIISKKLIPDNFKKGWLEYEILERWSDEDIKNWAKDKYWFQSFPWSPQVADSRLVWDAINHENWGGKTVLDIGCHYGFHLFRASENGAICRGVDTNSETIKTAKVINDHIEMRNVTFSTKDDGGHYDYIFYLSVHHQIDPDYSFLQSTLFDYKKRCKKLFVELIRPPMFGAGKDIDALVGGKKLLTYKHKVRGERTVYEI